MISKEEESASLTIRTPSTYLKEERYDKDAVFYDYKAQRIYFHEWYEPALTGDCDYAWPAACNYYARVYDPYFVV